MKKTEFQTLRNKPIAEMRKELHEFRTRLGNLKFDLAAGKVKNIREIRATKKNIAQLLTAVKEKSLKEPKNAA